MAVTAYSQDGYEAAFFQGLKADQNLPSASDEQGSISYMRPTDKKGYKYDLYRVETTNLPDGSFIRQAMASGHVLATVRQGFDGEDLKRSLDPTLVGEPSRILNSDTYLLPLAFSHEDPLEHLKSSVPESRSVAFKLVVASLEYDYVVFATDDPPTGRSSPNDPEFAKLWGLNNTGQTGGTNDADVDALEAWGVTTGDSSIVVAVIDSGVDRAHEDLADNAWVNVSEKNGDPGVDDDGNGLIDDIHGWNFYGDNNDPRDDNGHGTHVAGTIGAVGNNSKGVIGVCPEVSIMAVKFLGANGSGQISDAIASVNYTASFDDLLLSNNSWGGGGFSAALKQEIDRASIKGQLFVAAAGNNGRDIDSIPHYPASYSSENIISVASTDHSDKLSGFSNFGESSVDLAAPGSNVYSTFPGGTYKSLSGTSMAAPHVAGGCALLKARSGIISHLELRARIIGRGDRLALLNGKTASGRRLNVDSALIEIPAVDMPVGAIVPFFGDEGFLPDNWALCVGQKINDPASPLNGKTVPNMSGKFARGASSVSPVGTTGGHDHTPNHTHHVQGVTRSVWFGIESGNGYSTAYNPASRAQGFNRNHFNLGVAKGDDNPYRSHGHMNGSASISTMSGLAGGIDNRPAFVSLNYIIRIK